jgi:hypothetical protein
MRFIRGFLALILITALSTLAAAQRKNPRDFPNGVMCPIHLGWEVDPSGTPNPNSTPRIQEGLTFVAEQNKAVVTFLACDRNSALDDRLGVLDPVGSTIQVRVDDVSVIREDVFLSHQKATVPEEFGCYFSTAHPFPEIAVGSVFDPTIRRRANPFSGAFPFFDDFSNAAVSDTRWRLGGAQIDPSAGNLLLALEGGVNGEPFNCTAASFKVNYLVPGETYVLDFKWDVLGADENAPALLTSFDLTPGK